MTIEVVFLSRNKKKFLSFVNNLEINELLNSIASFQFQSMQETLESKPRESFFCYYSILKLVFLYNLTFQLF